MSSTLERAARAHTVARKYEEKMSLNIHERGADYEFHWLALQLLVAQRIMARALRGPDVVSAPLLKYGSRKGELRWRGAPRGCDEKLDAMASLELDRSLEADLARRVST